MKSLARLAAEEAFSAPRDAPIIERIQGTVRQALPVAEEPGPHAPPHDDRTDSRADTRADTRAPRVFRVASTQADVVQPSYAIAAAPAAALPRPIKPADTRRPGPVHVVYNAPARPEPVIQPAPAALRLPVMPRDVDSRIQAGLDLALSQVASSEFKDVTRRLDALKAVLATIRQARTFRISD